MSTADVETIARIVANQNFAMLEARAKTIAQLRAQNSENAHLYLEEQITLGQIDRYRRARAAQASEDHPFCGDGPIANPDNPTERKQDAPSVDSQIEQIRDRAKAEGWEEGV